MSKFKHAFKHQAWVQQKCEQEMGKYKWKEIVLFWD